MEGFSGRAIPGLFKTHNRYLESKSDSTQGLLQDQIDYKLGLKEWTVAWHHLCNIPPTSFGPFLPYSIYLMAKWRNSNTQRGQYEHVYQDSLVIKLFGCNKDIIPIQSLTPEISGVDDDFFVTQFGESLAGDVILFTLQLGRS